MRLVRIEGTQGPRDAASEGWVKGLGERHRALGQSLHVLGRGTAAARAVHAAERVLHFATQLQRVRVAFQVAGISQAFG